jgi:hypothetical protein
MKKGFAPIIIVLALLVLGGLVGGVLYLGRLANQRPPQQQSTSFPTSQLQVSPAPTSPQDTTANWKTYEDTDHHFKFQYPNTYSSVGRPTSYSSQDLEAIISFRDSGRDAKIGLYFDPHVFSLEYLKSYAPTGAEDFAPDAQQMGNNTFYYYGPGGGGVAYPDQYFFNLNGKTLHILFDGPYINDKTPPQEAKDLEKQILSTLHVTN